MTETRDTEQSAATHAQTVREALGKPRYTEGRSLRNENLIAAAAALDALVAQAEQLQKERDEARRTRFQADNLTVVPEDALIRERLRAEAAEQERDEARETVRCMGEWLDEEKANREAAEAQVETWNENLARVQTHLQHAVAEASTYREALRGWEVRTDDQETHSVERGTVVGHDWEQIVEGLSYEQAEAIEDFLRAVLAGHAPEPGEQG